MSTASRISFGWCSAAMRPRASGWAWASGSPRFCSACSNGLEDDMKQHPDYDFWFLAVGFFSGVVLTLLIQAVAR